jgi:hypothetical protein
MVLFQRGEGYQPVMFPDAFSSWRGVVFGKNSFSQVRRERVGYTEQPYASPGREK